MTLAPELGQPEAIYVDGKWRRSAGEDWIDVIEAATEDTLARVPQGSPVDVDLAVEAAHAAFPAWAVLPSPERAHFLSQIADELEACDVELAETISREVGTPIRESRIHQVGRAVATFRTAAALASECVETTLLDRSILVPTPIGVVACIVPWNYPLYLTATKVAPALAAGCTVVVKPSEVAPLAVIALAAAADRVGLPVGVLNVVSGTGAAIGEALATHPKIDAVSLTGSAATGRRVAALAGASLKRVTLELGGKSPSLVLADGDLEAAVQSTIRKCFQNSGQTCAALTRLLVPLELQRDTDELAYETASAFVPGDPLDERTLIGPLASASQRASVRTSIGSGVREGARLILGGSRKPRHLRSGYYVQPTVFSGVTRNMTVATDEVFGPVLAIQAYGDEAEGIALANGTNYGLAAAVWSRDEAHALEVAGALRAGSISINNAPTHPDAPFGGFKESGFGRERGRHGIHEYLTTRALHRTES